MSDAFGPGVPEAIPRTLQMMARTLGELEIDRLWVFPPLVNKRKERGLVAVSCFTESGKRILYTAQYSAERSGTALNVDSEVIEQGRAPDDRLSRVIAGVVRRSEIDLGKPRMVKIAGNPEKFQELLNEFDPSLLDDIEA